MKKYGPIRIVMQGYRLDKGVKKLKTGRGMNEKPVANGMNKTVQRGGYRSSNQKILS